MLEPLKTRAHGLTYLLTHPSQLKWIIIREIRYGQRLRNKRKWVEWQKHDAHIHISMMETHLSETQTNTLNTSRIRTFTDIISRHGDGLEILDTGCGNGVISEPIMRMGNYVTSLELPEIATLARRCRVLSVIAGDAEQLAFASNVFDMIIASEVVEHLWNPESFFDEAYRVLRAGGYLIIETPEGEGGLRYDSHRYFFTEESLAQSLGSRFKLCEVRRLAATGSAQTTTIIVLFRKS